MIKLINLKSLKPHERIRPSRLVTVNKLIVAAGFFTKPIIVENKDQVILDGHHRAKVLMALGYKKIPAYLVNYSDPEVRVNSRRSHYAVSKDLVIARALAGRLYPARTSRHFIPHRPKNYKIKLASLK